MQRGKSTRESLFSQSQFRAIPKVFFSPFWFLVFLLHCLGLTISCEERLIYFRSRSSSRSAAITSSSLELYSPTATSSRAKGISLEQSAASRERETFFGFRSSSSAVWESLLRRDDPLAEKLLLKSDEEEKKLPTAHRSLFSRSSVVLSFRLARSWNGFGERKAKKKFSPPESSEF